MIKKFFFIIILLLIPNSLLYTIPSQYIKKFESINSEVKRQLHIKKINSSSYFFTDGSSDFIYDIYTNKINYLKPSICLNKTNCPYISIKNNNAEYSIFQYGNNLQIINLSNNKTIYTDIVTTPIKSICKYNDNEFIYNGGGDIQNLYKISYSGKINYKVNILNDYICFSTNNNFILYFSHQNQNFIVYTNEMKLIYFTYSNLNEPKNFHILEMENNILIICFFMSYTILPSVKHIRCIKGNYTINNNQIQFDTDYKSNLMMNDCSYDDFNLIYYNSTTFLISCGIKKLKITKANYSLQIIDTVQIENNEFDYIQFTSLSNNLINFIMSSENNHYYYNYYIPICENKIIYLKSNENYNLKNILFDNNIEYYFLNQIKFTYLEDNDYIKFKKNDTQISSKEIYNIEDLIFNSRKNNIKLFYSYIIIREEPNLFKTDINQSNQCILYINICHENCERCSNIGNENDNNCEKCIKNYAFMENTRNCYNINDIIPDYFYSKTKDLFISKMKSEDFLNELKNNENYTQIIDIVKNNVKYNSLKDFLFISNNFTIEIFDYKNTQIYLNTTNIYLNECENILKEKYKINKDEDLIILKINFINEEYHIIKFSFLIYSQLGKELNLSFCNNNNITIKSQITFSLNNDMINAIKKGYDIFDSSSIFYNDICLNFKSIKGKDININDRKKEFYKNYILCPSNCKYVKFELNDKKIECSCLNANYEKLNEEYVVFEKIENDFNNKYSWSNLKILKCLNKNNVRGFKKFLSLINFFILIITIVLFILYIYMSTFKRKGIK